MANLWQATGLKSVSNHKAVIAINNSHNETPRHFLLHNVTELKYNVMADY